MLPTGGAQFLLVLFTVLGCNATFKGDQKYQPPSTSLTLKSRFAPNSSAWSGLNNMLKA